MLLGHLGMTGDCPSPFQMEVFTPQLISADYIKTPDEWEEKAVKIGGQHFTSELLCEM